MLLVVVFRAAGFDLIRQLLGASRPDLVCAAGLVAGLTIVFRGLRLVFLLPAKRLGILKAAWIAAAAQIAAMFIPARIGEFALPLLLHRLADWEKLRGLTTLVAARLLDLAALGVWAAMGIIVIWGFDAPLALAGALLLLIPAILLPRVIKIVDRFVSGIARHGESWERISARVHRMAEALSDSRAHPLRWCAAAAASFMMWMSVWLMTWLLLRAMGLEWELIKVSAGSALASLANILPINLIANIGTLEAGWTAAFTALGYPLEQAAASGISAHIWALVFVTVYGVAAWIGVLLTTRSGS